MKIGFRGLIAFTLLDQAKPYRYAGVLMKHGPHEAVLSVPVGKFLAGQSTLPGTLNSNGTLRCFTLSGRILTSLGSGIPTLNANFDEVPSTKEGFPDGKTLHATIKGGNPALFSAVFEFPAGDLELNTYFAYKGSFNGQDYRCIPKTVLFTKASADPVTFYIDSLANTVVVEGDAVVAITNLDPAAGGGHYHAFEKLFNEAIGTIHEPKSDQNQPCTPTANPTPVLTCTTTAQDPDVDCSPVRFP